MACEVLINAKKHSFCLTDIIHIFSFVVDDVNTNGITLLKSFYFKEFGRSDRTRF